MRESLLTHLQAPPLPGSSVATEAPLALHAFAWEGDQIEEGVLSAPDGRWWWIASGVPRILPATLYRNQELEQRYAARLAEKGLAPVEAPGRPRRSLEARTIDRFGSEWIRFRDWGHLTKPPEGVEPQEWQGGLWENTLSAFRSKTFLAEHVGGELVLDAGCGNGRFVAASLHFGAREVIGVDLGWGADMAYQRFRDDPRVHIVQASLFELPLGMVDVAFSLGVLMHTGDAHRALRSVAGRVTPGGLFAARMYHRGNWAYELTDGTIRAITTRLPKGAQLAFSRAMARFGRALQRFEDSRPGRQGLRLRWYQILRNWPTVHHNLDWWSAPIATHHTVKEVESWVREAGLEPIRSEPAMGSERFGFWAWPEALTLLARRPVPATVRPTEARAHSRQREVQAPLPAGR